MNRTFCDYCGKEMPFINRREGYVRISPNVEWRVDFHTDCAEKVIASLTDLFAGRHQ